MIFEFSLDVVRAVMQQNIWDQWFSSLKTFIEVSKNFNVSKNFKKGRVKNDFNDFNNEFPVQESKFT